MSHKRIRVTPSTAKVSFIEILPSKKPRQKTCSLERSELCRPVAILPETDDIVENDDCSVPSDSQDETPTQRSYIQRQQRASEAWNQIREQLRWAFVESSVPSIRCLCSVCNLQANVMCKQCGPQVFFCTSCAESQHLSHNMFHRPQLWQVTYKASM